VRTRTPKRDLRGKEPSMIRRALATVVVVIVSGLLSLAFAQAAHVVTVEDAPLFVAKDERRVPLRTAKQGSRLKVVTDDGDWLLVEFEDPQWGRRQGYIQKRHIQAETAVPVDVSVREPVATPIADAGAQAAADVPLISERRGMPGGLKWTGVGLLAGGGATVAIGAAINDEDCYSYDYTCDELRQGFFVLGGILAGTGVTLLAVGAAKSGPVRTSMAFEKGRVILRQRVSF